MKIDDIVIAPHAFARFKQRHGALTGVQLNDVELEKELRDLIAQSEVEEESPVLQTRREAHGGIGTYFRNGFWRFVFAENRLETCEIAPQETPFVKNPRISACSEKTRFFIKIKLNRRKLLTKITRSFDKRTLHLQNLVEIDVIARTLRILGIEVNQSVEPNKLEVIVPQEINDFRIEQLGRPESVRISLGRTESFPLGRQRVYCPGIFKLDLERILNFLQINNS